MQNVKEKQLSSEKCQEFYCYDKWGEGYFHVNGKGNIEVTPYKDGNAIDLYEIVTTVVQKGIKVPILIHFDGIIKNRLEKISLAFEEAINLYEYQNRYRHVFPIKVNQQKHVINTIRYADLKQRSGLEVGSKSELSVVLTMPDDGDSLFLCNGYKDEEYIELALLARKLGKRMIIIIEQPYEVRLILEAASRLGIEAEVGLRMKPSAKGSGRWASSGGDLAKFGLNTHDLLSVAEEFSKRGKETWIKLLHFHIGSQLSSIMPFKRTLAEAARFYTELAHEYPSLEFFDVGGGLGVDYDGSKTANNSSMSYTIEEYARDIVYTIGTNCNQQNIAHPVLISESGRAIVAHHSVLITEVVDVAKYDAPIENVNSLLTDHHLLKELYKIFRSISPANCLEALHDAHYLRQQVIEKFIQGGLSLKERAYFEQIYKHLLVKIDSLKDQLQDSHGDIEHLSEMLIDIYFCNFSIFQSLPDSWAIEQLFPVMPIHKLDQEPIRKGKIVDLTCDSDGVIERFVSTQGPMSSILLHEFTINQPYYLGFFLVGAYQEALGGLHNLFGGTNAIHIDLHEDGAWKLKSLIKGDTVQKALQYMQYDPQELSSQLHRSIESALQRKIITDREALMIEEKYKISTQNYTYLEF